MNRVIRRTAEMCMWVSLLTWTVMLNAAAAMGQTGVRPTQRYNVTVRTDAGFAKHPKLATPLALLASRAKNASVTAGTLPEPTRSAIAMGRMRIDRNGAVQVYIRVSDLGAGNLSTLAKTGVRVQLTDARRNIVQALVPAGALEAVAALPFVHSLSLPQYGYTNAGSVKTEGDAILKADKVRSQLGLTGKGVRVGVLSDGIANVFATECTTCGGLAEGPMTTNDVPTATGVRDMNGVLVGAEGAIIAKSFRASDGDLEAGLAGPGAEGTAMIEIIHDLAPDATFYFANFQTDIEFNAAMTWLAANSDVVVNDVSFFDPPYDGTNFVSANASAALNNDANPVRTLITAVGNEGQSHYLETYADSGSDASSAVGDVVSGYSGDFHKFQATAATKDVCGLGASTKDPLFLKSGAGLNVTMTWDDAEVATNDYDLWLFDAAGKVVAYSANLQNGGGQPAIEFLEYVNPGEDAFFYIAITNAKNAAAPKRLNLFIRGAEPIGLHAAALVPAGTCATSDSEVHNFNTPGGSIPAMADAGGSPVSVISVGAAPASSPAAIERYSSNGPTIDGRIKPDLTGVDMVAVAMPGGVLNPFWGTSAAAPHVAGVAALVLQGSPCLMNGAAGARLAADGRKVLYDSLTKNAFDLGAAGVDNVFGYGMVDALSSATAMLPVASIGGDQAVAATSSSGATVAFDASGSVDPASCPLSYAWTGDCGEGAGAKVSLNCPLGKNNVTLAVSNNGGVTTSQSTASVTVTDFAVSASSVSASVASGRNASYLVSVSPQGGVFGNSVALSCATTAPNSACTVTPATVIPGSVGTSATVNVNTTGTAPGNYAVRVTATSNSLTRTQEFALSVNDFKIAGSATSATVTKGGTAIYNLTVGPGVEGGNFGDMVQLSCAGAPSEASCTVSPESVTPGTTSAAVTVTVMTTAQKVASLDTPGKPNRRTTKDWLLAMVAVSGMVGIGRVRSRRVRFTIAIVLVFAATAMLTSCGGGGATKETRIVDQGTPAGSYTLTVTGTSGTLSHSTALTLMVQ